MPRAERLEALLREGLQRAGPGAPFLTDVRSGERFTYQQLRDDAAAWEQGLAGLSVGPGDRVAHLPDNRYPFYPLLLASAARGAALVPLGRGLHPDELQAVLRHCQPAACFHDGPAPGHPGLTGWRPTLAPPAPPERAGPRPRATPGRVALLVYTSGTTSASKAVMLTHRNLCAMARTFRETYGLQPGWRLLCVLPLHHINAPMITGLACVAAGAHVHLAAPYGFTNARSLFDYVERYRITALSLTPSILASLLQLFPRGAGPRDLSSVRLALVGTAHLDSALWRRFEDTFGIPCYQGYGLTETTTWATMTPPDARKRRDTVGLPVGCEVRIDGPEEGEVLIRGPIVMRGYAGARGATRRVLRDGWLHTGDVGRLEPDGQLVITGRLKNIVKRRGVLIYPEELDRALLAHPQVRAACAVGLADPVAGERLVAAYEGELAEADAAAHLRSVLSAFKLPDEVQAVAAIPRGPVGKPDLGRLRALLDGSAARQLVGQLTRYKQARAKGADLPALAATVQRALLAAAPLRFVGLWGVARRAQLADADRRALDRLARTVAEVRAHPEVGGAELHLLLADVHGRLNGVPPALASAYLQAVAAHAARRGLQVSALSQLWREAGLREQDREAGARAPALRAAFAASPLREQLLRQAAGRCPPGRTPEEHARQYFWTVTQENPHLAQRFAGHIFFTYSGPDYRPLLPALPTVHWHSLRPGVAHKPWDLPGDPP